MMKARWRIAVIVLLAAVACGAPALEDDGVRPAASAPVVPEGLEVTCTRSGGTEIEQDAARVGPAGLEVHVRNLAREPVSLNGIGWDFGEGESTETVPVKPKTAEVACWPHSLHEGREPEGLPVEIVDPDGLWVDPELQCRSDMSMSIISDHFFSSPGKKGDPVEIGRAALKGLDDDDVVERAGYPEERNPLLRVVRDGRTVAAVNLDLTDEGGYLVGGADICGDSGIRFE